MGWYKKLDDKKEANKLIYEKRLLKFKELRKLLADGKIFKEKYFSLNKSFILDTITFIILKQLQYFRLGPTLI